MSSETPRMSQQASECTPKPKTCACCNEDCHDILHNDCIIEIAVRNPSVYEYMSHWEKRTEKAESEITAAQSHLREVEKDAERLNDLCISKDKLNAALTTERNSMERTIDALLDHCPDAECGECAKIICAHGDPLHFHHDGCPSCAETKYTT